MATLTIRRLDDEVYARLQDQARVNKRSLEAEARLILELEVQEPADIISDLLAFHEEMTLKHGLLDDSTPLIREQRSAE